MKWANMTSPSGEVTFIVPAGVWYYLRKWHITVRGECIGHGRVGKHMISGIEDAAKIAEENGYGLAARELRKLAEGAREEFGV